MAKNPSHNSLGRIPGSPRAFLRDGVESPGSPANGTFAGVGRPRYQATRISER